MNNFLKHRALGVISLLLTSYARIRQITGGLAGSSRHSGNNPMGIDKLTKKSRIS